MLFSSFCLFSNDLFLFLSGINNINRYINMVTVEASVMSLVCWNKVFLQCWLSPGKRWTNLLMVCWGLRSAMIRQGYKKKTFACPKKLDLSSWIACNPIFQHAFATGLIPEHRPTWCFTKHMGKNCKQNTWAKHPSPAKFIEEEVPLKDIH